MPELLEVQRDIAASIRDAGLSAQAGRWVAGDPALVTKRLAIYRGNTAANAAYALGSTYPVVRQIVGDEFFEGLAREYQRAKPSNSGDLSDYGAELAAFLTDFPHAQSLPYLPDVARLEWAIDRAYGAENVRPCDTATLLSVASERPTEIRLGWAGGTAIINSEFPIARIWTIHQASYVDEFTVDWSVSERVLVAREGLRVAVSAIGAGEAAFIANSLNGAALGAAVAAALAVTADFNLRTLLARVTASNLISGSTLDDTYVAS